MKFIVYGMISSKNVENNVSKRAMISSPEKNKPNFSFSFIVIYKCINETNKENKLKYP